MNRDAFASFLSGAEQSLERVRNKGKSVYEDGVEHIACVAEIQKPVLLGLGKIGQLNGEQQEGHRLCDHSDGRAVKQQMPHVD